MGSVKKMYLEETEKEDTIEGLKAEIGYLQSRIHGLENLIKEFGLCHPDIQVARVSKVEAVKIQARREREQLIETVKAVKKHMKGESNEAK